MVTLGFIDTSKESQSPRTSSVKKKMLVARSKISLNDVLGSSTSLAGLLPPAPPVARARATVAAGAGDRRAAEEAARTEAVDARAARSRCAMAVGVVMVVRMLEGWWDGGSIDSIEGPGGGVMIAGGVDLLLDRTPGPQI